MFDTTTFVHLFMIGLLLLGSSIAQADEQQKIYKTRGPHGEVIFTDTPPKTPYETIQAAPVQTLQPVIPSTRDNQKTPVSQAEKYHAIAITAPVDGSVFHNVYTVDVMIAVDPALQENDVIQLYINDAPYESPHHNTEFQLQLNDRGTYQLRAEIHDKTEKTLLKSDPVTIHLQQFSELFKKNNAPHRPL